MRAIIKGRGELQVDKARGKQRKTKKKKKNNKCCVRESEIQMHAYIEREER